MPLSRWTRLCLAAAGGILLGALLTPAPVGAGPNGKGGGNSGGGGDNTPAFIPVPAIFEHTGHDLTLGAGETALDDSALAEDGGWTHFANLTGNYTFQIGDLGKKPVAGDRTLSVDLSAYNNVSANPVGPGWLHFNTVFMAFNRYDCEGGTNAFGGCSADGWRNPDFEEFRYGLLRMSCGEEVNVGITMRGAAVNGKDYLMSCNESTDYNETNDPQDPDIEFATAACVHQDGDACDQWLIYAQDRNMVPSAPDGPSVSCSVREDERRGADLGVFDLDFRIHLCADGAACPPIDPLLDPPTCIE